MVFSIVLQIWFSIASMVMHDIHLSKTLVEYNEETHALEIIVTTFIDDFDFAVSQESGLELKLMTPKEIEVADSSVFAYLQKHLSFSLEDSLQQFSYIGKEVADDILAMNIYLEIPLESQAIGPLHIKNDVLFEVYDDQQNIMKIKFGPRSKKMILFKESRPENTVSP